MLPKEDPHQSKIIFYDVRNAVPDVTPARPIGSDKTELGINDHSGRTLIAQSPNPLSKKQFILEPDRPEPIPTDVPTPNLVALQPPPAPPPPKPQPRAFTPPPVQSPAPKSHRALALDPPPSVDATKHDTPSLGAVLQNATSAPKLPVRQFVPPPFGNGRPVSGGEPVKLPEAPAVGMGGGAQSVQAVVVGLAPAMGALPTGSRPAQFAVAPNEGPASSGSGDRPGSAVVPGVSARGVPGGRPRETGSEHAEAANATVPAPARRLLREYTPPTVNRTMSAPLRPSSRVIPSSVEARFANRVVYTLVIPGPNLPEYSGDWVLWFSERASLAEGAGRMLSPVPLKKYVWAGGEPPNSSGAGTIQLAAVVDREGHVSAARVLRGGATAEGFRQRAIQELQSWDFQPALLNGEAIEVDVVVEISFQFVATH
ncbi:MAG TPA: energy transducer TonB [Candidatus Solibacter sp.]|nr:energy transducer TonB [Candidatus Solibacter sp.]